MVPAPEAILLGRESDFLGEGTVEIDRPLWILLGLPAAATALWICARMAPRRLPLRRRVLGAGILLACLGAMAGLSIPVEVESVRRVFLLDLSRSFERSEAMAREAIEAAPRDLDEGDRIGLVTFAERTAIVVPPGPPSRLLPLPALSAPGSSNASDLEAGLRLALRADPSQPPTEIVLFSDGRETSGNALLGAAEARSKGVPVSASDLGLADLPDLRVEDLRTPAEVRPGEAFEVEAIVSSSVGGAAVLSLIVPGGEARRRSLLLHPSRPARVLFEDRIDDPGLQRYEVRLRGLPAEANTENNWARSWVRVGEGIDLLAITRSPARVSPLERLPGVRLTVQGVDEGGPVARADLIVIDNLSRDDLGEARIEAIARAVREAGTGLLVLGGLRSFGPGGYAGSGLDPLLPVASDPEEGRSSGISLAIVLDASGSMAESVEGETKFRRAVRAILPIPSLGPSDRIEVITFREKAEVAVPFSPVGSQAEIREALLETAPGRGTRLFPALERGILDLDREGADRIRHMIVLSDGRSEEPEEVWEKWEDLCRLHPDVSASVIAVGRDVDEGRLRRIARAGGGRYRRIRGITEEISEFYRSEVSVARGSLVRTGRFEVEVGEAGGPVAGLDRPPPLFGFVATAPKEGASVHLRCGRYPVLAGWRAGLGRVLAFTAAIDTEWGRSWRSWDSLPAFLSGGIRWAARPADLAGLDLRITVEGGETILEVESRGGDGPRDGLKLLAAVAGEEPIPLRQVGPGTYRAALASPEANAPALLLLEESEGGRRLRGAVPWEAGARREMHDIGPNRPLLETIASVTGGRYGPTTAAAPAGRSVSRLSARALFLWAALLLFTLEIAISALPLTRPVAPPIVDAPPRAEGGPRP